MIKTGGGTYDRVKDPKAVYFLAGNAPDLTTAKPYASHLLIAVNELFGKRQVEIFEKLVVDRRVLLDSGIFNLTNKHAKKHKITIDEALSINPVEVDGFEELHNHFVWLCKTFEDRLWGYIELDQGGADKKRETRAQLHAEGLTPIPVYHPLSDGWDYFDELASTHDRLCVGNIAQANRQVRQRILHTMFVRKLQYPHLWIHVLGLTQTELFWSYPFESCDSSAWLRTVRWSGYSERSCGKVIGNLPKNYQYRLGKNQASGPESDHAKCKRMGVVGVEIQGLNLQCHIARLKEEGYNLGL